MTRTAFALTLAAALIAAIYVSAVIESIQIINQTEYTK